MKLHIGCGARVLPGWINLDKYRKVDGALCFDATVIPWRIPIYKDGYIWEENNIPNNSVSVVYSEDFFEHLTQAEQLNYLSESSRIIAKDGIIRIVTPDLIYSLKRVMMAPDGSLDLTKDYYNLKHGHKLICTASYLFDLLSIFKFKDIRLCKKNESKINDFEGDSRPNPKGGWDRTEEGQIYIEAIKI